METLKQSPDLAAAPSVDSERQATRKTLRRAGVIAFVLVVVGAMVGLLPRWRAQEALAKATRELSLPVVTVVSPAAGQASAELILPAEIKPWLEAPIYPRATGYVKRYMVDIGDAVKAGDLLAEIDTPELNQELVQARAQLFMAEAAVPLAKATAGRWAELVKTTSVSEQEAAEKASELKMRLAAVDVSKANVARLEEMQRFQNVKAPFDGIITGRDIDNGQLVTAGSSRELFRLSQNQRLRVFVRVPQTVVRAITPGRKAELTIAEFPGRLFEASIIRSSGALTPESRTLLTELEVDNSKGEIMAGAYAQVRFPELNLSTTLQLPSNTLLFRPEGLQVGVVGSDGKVELRTLTIGRDFGPTLEVLAGVSTNERVILNPPDSLATGNQVQVAQAK